MERSPLAYADIMRDYASLFWAMGYVEFSTDSLIRHDVLVYILGQRILLEVFYGAQ